MKPSISLLVGLLVISLGATIYVAAERIGWERDYRTVAIAVDYGDLLTEGATEGTLVELAHEGIVAVVVGPAEVNGERIEELHQEGLEPVFLLQDLYRYDVGGLKDYLTRLSQLQPRLVLFQDEGRPAYAPGKLEEIEQALGADRALVGILEFSSQPEASSLYHHGFKRFVRAHTIKPKELERMTVSEALARLRRAARERNIRLLWVRLFDGSLDYNLSYLKRLISLLQRDGFRLGIPGSPPNFKVARPILALVLLGPLGLMLLAIIHIWKLKPTLNWLLVAAGISAIIASLYAAERPFILISAWGTAVIVPISAYPLLAPRFEGGEGSMGRGIAALFTFSALALLGGLWVGTLLGRWDFFIKLEQFRGVKAALLLPLLGVFLLHFARHGFLELKRFLLRRPALGELLLLLLGAGVLLIVLLRSDNYSTVTGLEERVRGALEALFYARPRFKEFLIGHPLLLLWGAYRRKLGDYAIVVLTLGMVGQVSIINTFAHLHTPLLLSLLRTANGLALGLLAGLILLGIARWGARLWRSRS